MIEDGYPKATCPMEMLKHIQKLRQLTLRLMTAIIVM